MHRAGPIGRLTAVIVDESVRGQGIGRALVATSSAFLFERGCAMIEGDNEQLKKRTDAHAFYEGLSGYTGFEFPLREDAPTGLKPRVDKCNVTRYTSRHERTYCPTHEAATYASRRDAT